MAEENRILDRKLSNLELTVLGLAWLRGPCTIYALMKELSLSASSFHKNRAGTTYSIAKRLLQFGLLETLEANGSDETPVRLTHEGLSQLKFWLEAPIPIEDVAHSADLIRLRFFFLGAIGVEERLSFIDSALEGLREFMSTCRDLLKENERIGDYFGVLATLSTLFETQSRIQWLESVREFVSEPLADRTAWVEKIVSATFPN